MPKKSASTAAPKPKRELTVYQQFQKKNLKNSIYNTGTQQEKMRRTAAEYNTLKKYGILEKNTTGLCQLY